MFGMGTGGTSLLSTPAALKNRIEILTDEVFRELKKTNHKRKSNRPISTCKLNMSPCLHFKPINLVVYKGSYSEERISYLKVGFTLRCFQRLSVPHLAASTNRSIAFPFAIGLFQFSKNFISEYFNSEFKLLNC